MRILEGLILGNTRLFWTANYMNNIPITIFCFGATAPSGQWPPHSRGSETTYNNPPQSEGLLRTSDRLVAETSTWQHTTPTTDIHVTGGIRTHNPSKWAYADPRLRPRGHCDQQLLLLFTLKLYVYTRLTRVYTSLPQDGVHDIRIQLFTANLHVLFTHIYFMFISVMLIPYKSRHFGMY